MITTGPSGAPEPAVALHRQGLDVAASWGVPAHLSVIYPFVPPSQVDDDALFRLAEAVRRVPEFDCTFARTAWFGEDVLWLAPDPDGPFRALTRSVLAAFPDHPPYGGVHGEPIPHLTVAESRRGNPAQLHAAERAVAARLPVSARIRTAALLTGRPEPDSWQIIRYFSLARR